MISTVVVVVIILVFLYFVMNPEHVPAFLKRAAKDSEDSEDSDDDDSPKIKRLIKRRNALIEDIREFCE
jgi:hypothetical protein